MFYIPFYICRLIIVLVLNAILLSIICMILWGNRDRDYIDIIYQETSDWSTGAIQDIATITL